MNDLGLEQTIDRFSKLIVVAVTDASQRGFDPSLGEALGVFYGQILRPAVRMVRKAGSGLALMNGLFQSGIAPLVGHPSGCILLDALHLPALMLAGGALTTALVARTLLWNLVLGLAYGAAFIRYSLEAAMIAHAATHVGFTLATL